MDRILSASVCPYTEGLRRHAMKRTRDRNEADDLVQESLTRALVAIDGGHDIRNLRAYLFAIFNNLFANELLRRRRAGKIVSIDDEAVSAAYPPRQGDRLECRDLVYALRQLPIKQKEIVVMIGLDGFSYQTAADVLGIPVGTVMSRLSRGRATLKRIVEGEIK